MLYKVIIKLLYKVTITRFSKPSNKSAAWSLIASGKFSSRVWKKSCCLRTQLSDYKRILNRGPPKQADIPIRGKPCLAMAVSAIKSGTEEKHYNTARKLLEHCWKVITLLDPSLMLLHYWNTAKRNYITGPQVNVITLLEHS